MDQVWGIRSSLWAARTEGSAAGIAPAWECLPLPVERFIGTNIDIFHRVPDHQRKLLANPKNGSVAEAACSSTEAASETESAAGELARMATQLQSLVERFKM